MKTTDTQRTKALNLLQEAGYVQENGTVKQPASGAAAEIQAKKLVKTIGCSILKKQGKSAMEAKLVGRIAAAMLHADAERCFCHHARKEEWQQGRVPEQRAKESWLCGYDTTLLGQLYHRWIPQVRKHRYDTALSEAA